MRGVIYMTALIPTIGHQRLIDFAFRFLAAQPGSPHLKVIVSSRSQEPQVTKDRVAILRDHYQSAYQLTFVDHQDDNAPQNPSTDDEWRYWTDMAGEVDFVIGSELYGLELGKRLNAQFIPCDINREVLPVVGSDVRQHIWVYQDEILPAWVKAHQINVVLFGQESVGKTTLARELAEEFRVPYHHEWARQYLETVGPELTQDKMNNIAHGQAALESMPFNTLVRVLDTDLLSTLGYYQINGMTPGATLLENTHNYSRRSDRRLYLIPSDQNVPFEPDALRYGGNKRESSLAFWVQMLESRGLTYRILEGSLEERIAKAQQYVEEFMGLDKLRDFIRD